jgi:hypothetical protein
MNRLIQSHFEHALNSSHFEENAMIGKSMRILAFSCVALAVLFFVLTPMQAQQTLGALNGTVVDASGAAVPNATVTATDNSIGVTRSTKSQGNGFYQIFNLPIGTYTITVTHDGFETSVTSGLAVQEARATTANTTLKVGKVTESVQVTANPLLNATDATNGYTLDASQIQITPLATGSFTQLAVLSPGVNAELLSNLDSNSGLGNQPIWANGQRDTSNTFQVNGVDSTNLFNGKSSSGANSQRYNFNIGGGSTSSTSSAGSATVGGANPVGTSVYGSNGNSLPSPPPDFVEELRVNTSMYDAQQGATAGAQIDVNTKTGTNDWHGSLYSGFANNALNAAPFFFNQEYQLSKIGVGAFPESLANPFIQQWDSGFTAGGPLKKNKLFFFIGYQFRANRDESTGLTQMTVPSGLSSDRSTAGLEAAYQSYAGCTTCTVTIDSIAAGLLNATLPNGQYLIPSAQSTSPYAYGVPNVTLIGTSVLTSNQANAALDYDVTKNDRLGAKYFYQDAPITKPYGIAQTGGFPVTAENGSQVFALDNTIAISPRLNWEQRLGFVRESTYSYFDQTLTNGSGPANFGIGGSYSAGPSNLLNGGLPGLLIKDFAYHSGTTPGLKIGPYSSFADMGYYQNRLNPSTNVIFSIGKHTLVAGGGYSYTQLNVINNRTGIEQIQSSSFKNFLKGSVHSSNVVVSDSGPGTQNTADRYYRSNELAGYVQDKWQALTNLSITAGVRYDYHGGLTEKYGNMFNFDPSVYDVEGTPAQQNLMAINSGFVIAGNNKVHPTAGVSDSTLTGRQWGISPRLGFAFSPKSFHSNLVVSGGFGLYFDRGELFSYLSQPAGSGIGGPFGVTESAPLVNYYVGTGSTLENPLGSTVIAKPDSNPADITSQLNNVIFGPVNGGKGSPGINGTGTDKYGDNFGPTCGAIDNQENYLDCPDVLNFGAYDKKNVLPYTMNYTLNVQWQPTSTLALSLGYIGNRGRHSVIPYPLNEPVIPGVNGAPSSIWGETAAYGFEVLNQNSLPDGYDYAPIAGEPWNTEDGGNTDFRTPYIGYSPNAADFKTAANSAYDALTFHLEKRLSHHFQLGASYTWSHSLDEQSDIGLFFTGNDPNNLKTSWASSDFDRTHVFSANFQIDAPNAAKAHSLLSYFANDWHLTGIGILQSGEPYSLYEFYGAVGSVNFGDYPTLLNPVLGIKDPKHPGSALTGNNGAFRDASGNYMPHIDPSQIAINYIPAGTDGVPATDPVSGITDEYETAFNSGQRNIFRQAAQNRVDLSIRKDLSITEKLKMQFQFNIFNVFNTTSLDVPQDQAQIRQNNSCSNSAYAVSGNNCALGYVNYGQIATSNLPADQASALANLDQIPVTTGTGKSTISPLTVGGSPNNAANFGSVTGTIGGNRAITFGIHFTY